MHSFDDRCSRRRGGARHDDEVRAGVPSSSGGIVTGAHANTGHAGYRQTLPASSSTNREGSFSPLPELAEEARDFLLQPSIVRGTFAYWARR